MAENRLRVVDRGANRLLALLEKEAAIRVGVIGSEAAEAQLARLRKGSDETYPTDFTVAQVASRHEFGIDVPRRSWLRDYVDINESKIRKMLKNVAIQAKTGKVPLAIGLDALGSVLVGEIQDRISNGIGQDNSQETKDRKGSDTQLIDTGQFWTSITWARDIAGV